jgi:hypothetical protein
MEFFSVRSLECDLLTKYMRLAPASVPHGVSQTDENVEPILINNIHE